VHRRAREPDVVRVRVHDHEQMVAAADADPDVIVEAQLRTE
jgi:hypothetical protein